MSRRPRLSMPASRGALVLLLVLMFLIAGVPRFLERAPAPVASSSAAGYARLCRAHGGAPATSPRTGTRAPGPRCTVRYGGRLYVMDAITPHGFDEDTAHFQRQGCEDAARSERSMRTARHRRVSFIYHPATGVCEHRS